MAFAIIALIIVTAVVVGGYQLYLLQRSQVSAIEQSVPTLIHSQKLESQLAKLFALSNRLRNARSRSAVVALYSDIQKLEVNIQDTVANDLTYAVRAPLERMLVQGVQSLVQTLNELAHIRQQLIGIEKSLTTDRQVLTTLRVAFGDLIEPRSIMLSTALTFESDAGLDKKVLRNTISSQINLTEMSFRLSTAIDVAEHLSRGSVASEAEIDTTHLQFNLRSVAQTLISLENDEFRRELAKLIKQLRGIIYGSGGIVDKLELHANYSARFQDVNIRQSAIRASTSRLIESMVADAESNISESSTYFYTALVQTVLLLVVVGFSTALVIALASYYVVERQFNRRMSKLTSAVLDIAAGDLQRDVGVEGGDEIGLMANALAVFKNTANKLIHSNRELEQFAYAASHDLRSPLRAIENLAQWTLEDAGESLPDSCQENLTKLIERANRLSVLQTDLLEYSRVGHGEDKFEPVVITQLVDDLSEILDPERKFPIEMIGEHCHIHTYTTPLRRILMNLLNNAVKHHDLDHGNIKISVHYDASKIVIMFGDDGVGIEPQYHDQIFELFQRLQSQDIVEGSGLGLSLVRKLVERHGGKISVISNPAVARGTTFKFDWPVTYPQYNSKIAVGF